MLKRECAFLPSSTFRALRGAAPLGLLIRERRDRVLSVQNERITFDASVMGGKPCIRGMRVTVGTVLGLLASGHSAEEILKLYPYLERADIRAALEYAAWRVEEAEMPLERT